MEIETDEEARLYLDAHFDKEFVDFIFENYEVDTIIDQVNDDDRIFRVYNNYLLEVEPYNGRRKLFLLKGEDDAS